ncbi:MAG: aspartate--tRNA(Asn) ligase [Clostridiales bacterium]|nr:aspartate--tRNA(Asn) ligase [Clostridiales bacterium]
MQQIDGQSLVSELTLDDLKKAVGSDITFCACVHKLRKMSAFAFVILRTGRYLLQSVYEPELCGAELKELCEGAYIELTGTVKEEKRAGYGIEITLKDFKVLSKPASEYPLHVSDRVLGCTLDTNLSNRTVALRHPHERAVFKIAEGVVSGFRDFMLSQNFTEIHTPKICGASAEGGANIFKLKYFGQDAVLAQSPQFYKQTCVAFFDRVFEIAPVYRAEKHNSARHLNEYIGLDFEMGFIKDMTDVMQMETAMLRNVVRHIEENYQTELELLGAKLPVIKDIPAVTFFEALDILGKSRNQFDLDPTDELKLCEYAKEKYDSEFIFVTKFPGLKRPFYAMDSKDDPKLAESFDLLFRGLEITTGGQRIHDYDEQVAKLARYNIQPQELESYLSIHKYGMPPHGGLGIGLERLVMKLLGLDNIRQASLFPRDMHHLEP